MFYILNDDKEILDRHKLNVKIVKGERYFEDHNITRLVACCGTLIGKSLSGNGSIAASINEEFKINGTAVVIELLGNKMTEETLCKLQHEKPGNLSYIDGCSNSCVVSPPRNGDPCLNYLYFPVNINQTFHTHPSLRIGLVLNGSGWADVGNESFELTPGKIFLLDRFTRHRFRTENQTMSLIAFHPDSEDGPKDELNPMITRTYISK